MTLRALPTGDSMPRGIVALAMRVHRHIEGLMKGDGTATAAVSTDANNAKVPPSSRGVLGQCRSDFVAVAAVFEPVTLLNELATGAMITLPRCS